MELFGLLSILIYCLASGVVGARLVRLAARTGELPERLIGHAFLMGGLIGVPAMIASDVLGRAGSPLARPVQMISSVAIGASSVLMLLFWRRVFAPSLAGAGVLVGTWISCLVVLLVAVLIRTRPGTGLPADDGIYASLVAVQGSIYVLSGVAGARVWLQLRRRVPLGLASPVVANRVLLWALSSLGTFFQYGCTLALVLVPSERGLELYGALLSLCGLYSAVVITLAFFPPRGYVRWLEGAPAPA